MTVHVVFEITFSEQNRDPLQSYNNAQIGAFFSVLAMGFLIIGPILGIIALFYLKKYKVLFTASFKN